MTRVSARLPGMPASAPDPVGVLDQADTGPEQLAHHVAAVLDVQAPFRRGEADPPETSMRPSPLSSSRTTTSARTRRAVSAAAICGRSRS